uniref:Uncharacterized protein n=1 Tax=Glossina austeni TaxID=7395 RepID=A0A1A9VCC1_GLOAU
MKNCCLLQLRYYQDNKHWLDFEKSWLSELITCLHCMKLYASNPTQLQENITLENRHSRYVVFFLEYIYTRLQLTGVWETLPAIFTVRQCKLKKKNKLRPGLEDLKIVI